MVTRERREHPIKALLLEHGINQQQFAFDLNVSPSRVSMILNGWVAPSPKMKARIDALCKELSGKAAERDSAIK